MTSRGLLTVGVGDARFGIWVDEVLEIVRTPPVTRLPLAAPELAGVTAVRGVVVPVLDLGVRLLGGPAIRPGRLVLIRHDDTETMLGLLVDDVGTLLAIQEDAIRPPPPEAEAELPEGYVTGVAEDADGVVTILHLGRVAAPPEPSTEERWAD